MTASAKLIHDSVRDAYGTAHWGRYDPGEGNEGEDPTTKHLLALLPPNTDPEDFIASFLISARKPQFKA